MKPPEPISLTDSTPEQAAENITNAKTFDVDASTYKQYKPDFDSMLKFDSSEVATPTVKSYVSQTPEHTKAFERDVPLLSSIERTTKWLSDTIYDRPVKENQYTDLQWKKMNDPDNFTDDDEFNLREVKMNLAEHQNMGIASDVVSGISTMGMQVLKNAEYINKATLTAAGFGAGIGLAVPVPGAALATAGTLGAAALSVSVTTALALEGAKQQIAATYGTISDMEEDPVNPVQIDPTAKKHIAYGVGAISGVISGVVLNKVGKTFPFLNNFVSPKTAVAYVMNPTNAAFKQTISNIGKSMVIGGTGAFYATVTQILGEELARAGANPSKASFLNALVISSERIIQAVGTSALTTGTLTAAAGAASFGQTKKQFAKEQDIAVAGARDITPEALKQIEAPRSVESTSIPIEPGPAGPTITNDIHGMPVDRAVKILQFEQTIEAMNKAAKGSDSYKIAQSEFFSLRKQILEDSGLHKLWIDRQDLESRAKDEKSAKRVRELFDSPLPETNGPVAVDAYKLLDVAEEDPHLLSLVRLLPEDPNAEEVRFHLDNIEKAKVKREEILTKLGVSNERELTPEAKLIYDKALEAPELSPAPYDRTSYLNRPTLSEAIKTIMPESSVEKITEAQIDTRNIVADNITEIQQHEMDKVKTFELRELTEQAEQAEIAKMENDPTLKLVDKFTKYENIKYTPTHRYPKDVLTSEQQTKEMTLAHKKKGYSPFAIDPRTLQGSQKKYLNNKQLKKHKAFVEGGINADEAARLLGIRSGDDLLKIMAATPSREDILARRMKMKKGELEQDATDMVPLENLESTKMYTAVQKTRHQELKTIIEQNWPGFREGVKRIAKKARPIAEFDRDAKALVNKTKVGELNVKQYEIGEKRSHSSAIDTILKNDIERAVDFKESEILNIALQRETALAIGKSNRVFKLVKRLKSDANQKALSVSPIYENAVKEILDVFKLDPSMKGLAERDAFQKFLKETKERHEGIFDIPDRLLDVRESALDLTVEQLNVLGNRLQTILNLAKVHDKLYDKWNTILKIKNINYVAEELHDSSFKHPGYDPKKAIEKSENQINWSDRKIRAFQDTVSQLDRPQYVLLHLDNFKVGGIWNQRLWQPIKKSRDAFSDRFLKVQEHIAGQVEKYGKKEFENLNTVDIYIEELKDVKKLGDGAGTISKRDLLEIALHRGNKSNIDRMVKSWGVSLETWNDIFEKHLEIKDFDYIQHGIWDSFKAIEKDVIGVEQRTGNPEPKIIEPEMFVHRGIVRRGGFYPASYTTTTEKTTKNRLQGLAETKKQEKFANTLYAQAMTNQDYLESRTGMPIGSELSLDGAVFGNRIEEILHDIYHRESIRDVGLILANDSVMKDIKSIVGREGLNVLTDYIEDVAKTRQMSDMGSADKTFIQLMKGVNKNFGRATISFNPSSHFKQFESLLLAMKQMGLTGPVHIGSTIQKIVSNPDLLAEMYDFAEEIHPQIKHNRQNVDIHAGNSITEIIHKPKDPSKKIRIAGHKVDIAMPVNIAAKYAEAAGDLGLSYFEHFDTFNKTVTALSAYSQFVNGDAPNYPKDVIVKMTPEELHSKAKYYASETVELTQTSSSMMNLSGAQKAEAYKWAFLFYNDRNNTYNNLKMSGLQIKYKVKEAGEKVREGEFSKAGKAGLAGVGILGGTLFFLSAGRFLNALIDSFKEGNEDELPFTKDKPIDEHFTDLKNFYLKGSVQHALGVVPLASEMQYAIESYQKSKSVKFPFNSVLDTTTASVQGILMMLDLIEGDAATKYKNMAYAAGYLTGAPTPAAYKALKALSEVELPPVLQMGEWEMLHNRVDEFLKNKRDNKDIDPALIEDFEKLLIEMEQSNPTETQPEEKTDKEFLKDLEKLQEEMDKQNLTPNEKVKTSALQTIRDLEGFRAEAYQDTGGVWTIGYGTTKGVKQGDTITVEEAESRLNDYYDKMVKEIDPLIKRDLTPNQKAAIYSFAYNVGTDKFKDSTMLEKLNDPKYTDEEIAREFKKWIYDNGEVVEGLKNRRTKEESLFLAVDKNDEIPKG